MCIRDSVRGMRQLRVVAGGGVVVWAKAAIEAAATRSMETRHMTLEIILAATGQTLGVGKNQNR